MSFQAAGTLAGMLLLVGAGFLMDLSPGGWTALIGYIFWTSGDKQQ